MTPKALKTINSHAGHARFLATLEPDEDGCAKVIREIPRRNDIPSPYAYSPEWPVYSLDGREVIIRETSHKKFQVFAVDSLK